MKNRLLTTLLLAVLAVASWAPPAAAQRLIPSTTLSAAITSASQQTISLTSTASVTVGSVLWLSCGEQMQVISLPASGIAFVSRGYLGTAARTHANAEQVFAPASRADLQIADPDYGGTCTPGVGQAAVSPWINIRTGNVFVCRKATSSWNVTNAMVLTWNSTQSGTP